VDLLELVRRPPAGERRVWFLHAGRDQAGCRDGDVHYWHNLREYGHLGPKRVQPAGLSYLYRHRADPETLTNLADAEPDLERGYREAMELWLERTSSGENVRARLGAEEEARLRELGYAGDDEDDDDEAESEGGSR
jgi:hypothetical protein